jgi:hypothetical protein
MRGKRIPECVRNDASGGRAAAVRNAHLRGISFSPPETGPLQCLVARCVGHDLIPAAALSRVFIALSPAAQHPSRFLR